MLRNLLITIAFSATAITVHAMPVYFCKFQDLNKHTFESDVSATLCWALRSAKDKCNAYYEKDDNFTCSYTLKKATCVDISAGGKEVAIESCF